MTPGALLMLMNTVIIIGSVASGIFSDITNIAYESGIPQAQAATIIVYTCYGEIFFRFIWSMATRWFHTTTCQIMYCVISVISQVILALANSYGTFIIGLILHSAACAGNSGTLLPHQLCDVR